MKRIAPIVTALAASTALLLSCSTALATFTSPVRTPVSASGRITLRINFLTTDCTLSFSGAIAGPQQANISRATATCTTGTLTIGTPFSKVLLTSGSLLTGDWAMGSMPGPSPVQFVIDTTAGIVCTYDVVLAGAFIRGNPTVLGLGGWLQSISLDAGASSPICSVNPILIGALTLATGTV